MKTDSEVRELLAEYIRRMEKAKSIEESICIGSAIATLRKVLD